MYQKPKSPRIHLSTDTLFSSPSPLTSHAPPLSRLSPPPPRSSLFRPTVTERTESKDVSDHKNNMSNLVDDCQLESWLEEQLKVASEIVVPDQCFFALMNQGGIGFDEEYSARYKHCTIDTDHFAHHQFLLIGGVDVAFPNDESKNAIAVYVILCYVNFVTEPSVIYRSHQMFIPPPYIPSFLSFRESPPLLSLISKQLESHPEWRPQVIMVDGNGMWHERRAGLACFIGQCGIPCIGVGKSWYSLNGRNINVKKAVEKSLVEWYNLFVSCDEDQSMRDKCVIIDSIPFADTNTQKPGVVGPTTIQEMLCFLHSKAYGLAIPLVDRIRYDTLAYALLGHGGHQQQHHNKRGSSGRKNPIYISVGDNITLNDAVALVAFTCGVSRIPEPVREADLYGRFLLRKHRC
jgi:deoxyinosine 3'endonuclease (endonuclease V)